MISKFQCRNFCSFCADGQIIYFGYSAAMFVATILLQQESWSKNTFFDVQQY